MSPIKWNLPLVEGVQIRDRGDYIGAMNFFIDFILKHPENQAAYVELYGCYSKETGPQLIEYFSSLPPEASNDHRVLLGQLYLKSGEVKKAKQANQRVMVDYPNSKLAARARLNNLSIALYRENDLTSAASLYQQAISRPELSSEVELSLAQTAINSMADRLGLTRPSVPSPGGTSAEAPLEFGISQNHPNPFNRSTVIDFQLPKSGLVSLKVYDMVGREVAILAESNLSAGRHEVEWNPNNVSSGIYFYRIIFDAVDGTNNSVIKKMIIMK